jgi:hypothetical protein
MRSCGRRFGGKPECSGFEARACGTAPGERHALHCILGSSVCFPLDFVSGDTAITTWVSRCMTPQDYHVLNLSKSGPVIHHTTCMTQMCHARLRISAAVCVISTQGLTPPLAAVKKSIPASMLVHWYRRFFCPGRPCARLGGRAPNPKY